MKKIAKIALSELELRNRSLHGRFRSPGQQATIKKNVPNIWGVFRDSQNIYNIATMPITIGR